MPNHKYTQHSAGLFVPGASSRARPRVGLKDRMEKELERSNSRNWKDRANGIDCWNRPGSAKCCRATDDGSRG